MAEDPITDESDASYVADDARTPDEPGEDPKRDGAVGPAAPRDGGGGSNGSPEAGAGSADARVDPPVSTPDAQVPDTGTPTGKRIPVFVAAGYSGVRMMSKDLGKTWSNVVVSDSTRANKDDDHLLRAVKYGAGLFVAVGYRIWTSPDGVNWTERQRAPTWMGGMQYGAGLFVAAGGVGKSMFSTDGINWTEGKDRNGEPARTVAFGNGTFIAATDSDNWWSTTNGLDWKLLSGGHDGSKAVWCNGKAFSDAMTCSDPLARNLGRTVLGENVYVSAASGKIERSEDGKTWTMAADTSKNPVEDVAFGYVTE